MNPLLISAIISAVVSSLAGFGLAWKLQDGNINEIKLEQANERITQQRVARAAIERATTTALRAQSDATRRSVALRRSASAAATELDRLRTSTADAVRAASANADACTITAATIAGLFDQCGTELQSLAAKADRHVSDIKTLTEAWPQ